MVAARIYSEWEGGRKKREREREREKRNTGLTQSPGERSAELMVCDGYDGFAGSGGSRQ